MRSREEFNWTPIPSLYVYCAYRINENAINDRELQSKFSLLFNVNQVRTIESKISNYRHLSGEGRGLKKGARIAEIIEDQFRAIDNHELEVIYNSLDRQSEMSQSLRQMIIDLTLNWLREMPKSKAEKYLQKSIEHGLVISGFEFFFEELLSNYSDEASFVDEQDPAYQEQIQNSSLAYYDSSSKRTPEKVKSGSAWKRDPYVALYALNMAKFKCEVNPKHSTFTSKTNKKNFVEAHHLIPMKFQDEFDLNLDVPENIISLCPNCHRMIHHSIKTERESILRILFEKREHELKSSGFKITKKHLYKLYL